MGLVCVNWCDVTSFGDNRGLIENSVNATQSNSRIENMTALRDAFIFSFHQDTYISIFSAN